MSSENVSSVTDQKEINVMLQSGKMTFDGYTSLSIDMSQPRLNIGKLYEALFKDISTSTTILLKADPSITQDKDAHAIFKSVKSIIDAACEEINKGLPAVLEKLKSEIEKADVHDPEKDRFQRRTAVDFLS